MEIDKSRFNEDKLINEGPIGRMMKEAYFIGIDVGTQGARVVLLGRGGIVIGEKEQEFPLNEHAREEQSPSMWWDACLQILKALIHEARNNIDIDALGAIAVTSTSGTVIPLDGKNQPLHQALMYSDKRAGEVAPICKEAAVNYYGDRLAYTNFNASSGLSKMVWYVKHFPEKALQIKRWSHAADFITGKLCGNYALSDDTNALKSGFDIFTRTWPDYLFKKLLLKKEWLPTVVTSGSPIGKLSADLTEMLGLKNSIQVVAGMTDGCASQIASGAVKVGDWNTTIGTTMVVKGVTLKPVHDPEGRLYNHRHPEGYFMPGGAGNTGADWITLDFKDDLQSLNKQAENIIPSGYISWPLQGEGERFPFMAPKARGFSPTNLSRTELYTANLEGVAYIERYAYEMIKELSGEQIHAVYTAGGGSKSDIWLKIRSNVLNLPLYKMKYVSGAVGAAILAASQTYFENIHQAVGALTQLDKVIKPEKELVQQYDQYYKQFVEALKKQTLNNKS